MGGCIPHQPIFSLDKIPAIPHPKLVTTSDDVLQLNSNKFLRPYRSNIISQQK